MTVRAVVVVALLAAALLIPAAGAAAGASGLSAAAGARVASNATLSTGMAASLVVGQPGFSSRSNASGSGTNAAQFADNTSLYAIAIDAHGDLWVADTDNNRVLEFVPPFSNGMSASLVLGQSSLSGWQYGNASVNLSAPDGLAFDSAGDLWVADYGNNRVVEYVPPFATGMAAALVLGQSSFGPDDPGAAATNLSEPAGLGFDGSDLWVADYGNNRVLEYPSPFADGEAAVTALGQPTLDENGYGLSASALDGPSQVAFGANGYAWVADFWNGRVLGYAPPLTTGESASVVLGQPDFTTNSSLADNAFFGPSGVAVDAAGNVWVADTYDNRVLEFAGPVPATFAEPTLILGQRNGASFGAGLGTTGLNLPTAVVFDSSGDAWVADQNNTRVLEYVPGPPTGCPCQPPSAPTYLGLTADEWAGVAVLLVIVVLVVAVVVWASRRRRPPAPATAAPSPYAVPGAPLPGGGGGAPGGGLPLPPPPPPPGG